MSIPQRDPNYTMEMLHEAAERFIKAGQEYWEATHKAGLNLGAVIWVDFSDVGMAIFTRGEYKEALMSNIDQVGAKVYSLGGVAAYD